MSHSLTPVSRLLRPRPLSLICAVVLGAISLVLPGNVHSATPSGLVAAYSFDTGAGSTVADLSGKGNNGTLTNVTWSSAGRYGSAASFNGSSSLITVPDSSTLDMTGSMTLEAWVKPKTLGATWRTVVLKEQPSEVVYALYANSETSQPTGIAYTGGAERTSRGGSQLPVAAWTHLATTWNGTSVRLYVNGTLVASYAASGAMPISTGALRIGGNKVWSEWFDGLIDEVRVYNRALSQAEVQSDLASPIASGQTPPPSDTSPPTVPAGLHPTAVTATSVSLAWTASTDNAGVTGYTTYSNGASAGTSAGDELHRRRTRLRDELLVRGRRLRRGRQQVGQELACERLDGCLPARRAVPGYESAHGADRPCDECRHGSGSDALVEGLDGQRRRGRLQRVRRHREGRHRREHELRDLRASLRDELLTRGRRVRRGRKQVGQGNAPECRDGRLPTAARHEPALRSFGSFGEHNREFQPETRLECRERQRRSHRIHDVFQRRQCRHRCCDQLDGEWARVWDQLRVHRRCVRRGRKPLGSIRRAERNYERLPGRRRPFRARRRISGWTPAVVRVCVRRVRRGMWMRRRVRGIRRIRLRRPVI